MANSPPRLAPENFNQEDVLANHIAFFVTKGWLENNSIHPWSIQFNRFDEERRAWVPFPGKLVREDDQQIFYGVMPGGQFSPWAISREH